MVVAMSSRRIAAGADRAAPAKRLGDDDGGLRDLRAGDRPDPAISRWRRLETRAEGSSPSGFKDPDRPAASGGRQGHVADRLRCAGAAHALCRQADARPRPAAGDRAREPRLWRQARRAGRRLHRHRRRPEGVRWLPYSARDVRTTSRSLSRSRSRDCGRNTKSLPSCSTVSTSAAATRSPLATVQTSSPRRLRR